MKQLLVLSGKGGTGKTTVASAFIKLSGAKVYGDCDVDAPNLHLIRGKEYSSVKNSDYYAMPKAVINGELCTGCGICREKCRFNAIEYVTGDNCTKHMEVNLPACEGCGLCEVLCPSGAVTLKPAVAGKLSLYEKPDEIFSTAQLKIGSGTSGKLVAAVKKQMIDKYRESALESRLSIVDGSPGIGCPVISSLSGVDMVLIVAEPSMSGISDMRRILKTAGVFGTKAVVCVNKFNINEERTNSIIDFCEKHRIPFVGKIPFDSEAVKAVNECKSVADIDCIAGQAIKLVYENTMKILFENNK